MPTYKNISGKRIRLNKDDINVDPNAIIETKYFYRDNRLKLIDVKPYYSPFVVSLVDDVSDSDNKKYDVFERIFYIESLSGTLTINLNEPESEKAFDIPEGTKYFFDNTKGNIDCIYIKSKEGTSQYYIVIYDEDYGDFFVE
jgi:hypothetical protein